MDDRPETSKIEAVTRRVEQALKDGSIDAELASGREALRIALDALIEAERIDPSKLRRPITPRRGPRIGSFNAN